MTDKYNFSIVESNNKNNKKIVKLIRYNLTLDEAIELESKNKHLVGGNISLVIKEK